MMRALALVSILLISGCVTQIYKGDTLPNNQIARLTIKTPYQPGQFLLGLFSIGTLDFGHWGFGIERVDDTISTPIVDMLPGAHIVSATAEQGPTGAYSGVLGSVAFWRCKGSIEFDAFAGETYELDFNYDKNNPQLSIENKTSGKSIAMAPCKRISYWTDQEIENNETKQLPANQPAQVIQPMH
jgi:hypothetical protein